ncbi:MAG: hypothetical protein JWN13_3840 [Betaproteobacteria bacterium]|jgi:hypothetical protein|nr:hypothetical protein [Betaproteobacteria bacterium]MEA3155799.1 hypothetical protein [Betaproteobacteria bacterium]
MDAYRTILSPLGAQTAQDAACGRGTAKTMSLKPVIGLLDNSKPNVAEFLQSLEEQLRARNDSYEFVRLTKPRSAMACPDLDAFATQCDYVINAVAD